MRTFSITFVLFVLFAGSYAQASAVQEAPQKLQVAYDVDVVVAGGSTYAVAAAVEAAKKGASVFLCSDRPYLGEDLCMTMQYQLDPALQTDPLLKAIWKGKTDTTPLTIKNELDLALLDQNVFFLTGTYAQELVTDEKGHFAGITIVSRSGRHFVRGKVLIDATDQGILARQSKLPFSDLSKEPVPFTFRVAGGDPLESDKTSFDVLDALIPIKGKGREKKAAIVEYTYAVPLTSGEWSEIAKVEQSLRSLSRQRGMVECSERMTYNLGIALQSRTLVETWPGADKVDLNQFYHDDYPRYLVLGKTAAVSVSAFREMGQVHEMVQLGRRLGEFASDAAQRMTAVDGKRLAHQLLPGSVVDYDVRTDSRPIRSSDSLQYMTMKGSHLPVLGRYDVVVVGGGTSGAPAALGAAEQGAKTLVLEYLDELGGVGTAGMISVYWYGVRSGYTARVDRETKAGSSGWNIIDKSEWLRGTILKAGGDVWYRSYGCGALVEGNKVKGVVVATPFGRGVVLANTVIDSTGNSDIPIHAGADMQYSIDKKGVFSVQMAGYPLRSPGHGKNNTCYALVDDADAVDVWHLMMTTRLSQGRNGKKHYDAGQLLDSRERRRIVGDYTLTTQDILTGRKFPDSLLQMKSNFDAAAFPNSPMLLMKDMKGPVFTTEMPYRCFLPKGFDGILATGLGASAERDAMTLVRMQPDLQNQGYAVGIAASLAAKKDGDTRAIDVKQLQKMVIRQGILSSASYGQKDSFPLPETDIAAAVKRAAAMPRSLGWLEHRKAKGGRAGWKKSMETDVPVFVSLAKIVSHPELAIPELKKVHASSTDKAAKINCASILAVLGDDSAKETLIQSVSSQPWDKGYGLTSHRETHNSYTDMDRMIIALGMCSGDDVRKVLIDKLNALTPETELSHLLALSLALNGKAGADMVTPLAGLLAADGFAGHAQRYDQAYANGSARKALTIRKNTSTKSQNQLNYALKELMVAGMLAAAGDHEGRGRATLNEYQQEVSGQMSRYADYLLESIQK